MLSKKTIRYFAASMVFLVVAMVAFLCIPIWPASTAQAYVVATVFCLSIILEQVFFWIGNASRKQMERKVFHMRRFGDHGPGIISFSSNRIATICDWIMLASFITVVLEIVFPAKHEWLVMVSLAVLFLSFNLHCILNGKNYKYLVAYHKHKKGA